MLFIFSLNKFAVLKIIIKPSDSDLNDEKVEKKFLCQTSKISVSQTFLVNEPLSS